MDNRYVCIDTFAGFVPEHLEHEPESSVGTTSSFASNSRELVARLLRHWGVDDVELIQGDIATVPESAIPDPISVALIDVDLKFPVYEGLRRLYPKLAVGGIVVVDDCAHPDWPGAREGYSEFVREAGLEEEFLLGMGIVRRA